MTESRWTPPDQEARERIRQDLDTNLLVEAGAGSGKTTEMVGRMIELIRAGRAGMDQVAAVTFTRKAAAELKERFQERLEQEYRTVLGDATADPEVRDRISAALANLDRCYVGTIHSFCARLLRERPLEAGVPPDFQEISGPEEERTRAEAWVGFLERLASRPRARLARRLAEVGLRPAQLRGLFQTLSDNPDVRFPAPAAPFPDAASIDRVRVKLNALLDRSLAMMPEEEPAGGWDKLQAKVRELEFSRRYPGWRDDRSFLVELSRAFGRNHVTQSCWGADKATRQAAKALCADWEHFCADGSPATVLHARWLAHRYPVVIRFARAAAGLYAAERLRSGVLNFQDLLVRTARLLRERPDVRRELGERYRYLLIDEFQDTDPLQAEIVFLLGSDPAEGDRWAEVQPRPGALFVVGDPKQSIYRFRRADIALYGRVKRRFHAIGAVVELVANFRSTRPVETLVNRVFSELLPEEESTWQAAYAPMRVRPEDRPAQGVFWYRFEAAAGRGGFDGWRIHDPDSVRIASWIAERIARDERRPGDFMILTRRRKGLATYARALEERNIPVQVTGAKVGVEEELSDLILLLQSLSDPGNGVLTLAVMEGLFFGFSHEQLYQHVRLDGDFFYLRDQPADSPVAEALGRMREFWRMAREAPADVVVPKIVQGLGILPLAAAGELGGTRAGALLYALDALRQAAMDGATSLVQAVEVLQAALDQDEAEAPLFPGEGDAVRVMNLHKAKGLEAPVVVLADPGKGREHPVHRHITRDAAGRAVGFLLVRDESDIAKRCIARPFEWELYEAAEKPFLEAEEVRLLYVAATRAGDELVVGRCDKTEAEAFCARLHGALDLPEIARELRLEPAPPPAREQLRVSGEELVRRTGELAAARTRLAGASYAAGSATRLAKGEETFVPAGPAAEGARGVSWGTAVHRALELVGRGVEGEALRTACREILLEEGRVEEGSGEPTETEELCTLVERVHGSELWQRARAATRRHLEVPFLVALRGDEVRALDRFLPPDPEGADTDRLVEGVIDLAFHEPGRGWVIADYKTDVAARVAERLPAYQRQVELYALCWERLTGEPVTERQLFFTEAEPVIW